MANRPSTPFPTHHASLSDGFTTVNFIFCDSRGNVNPQAARRYALQRTAIKTQTGSGKYSDLEMPYLSIAQDDWQGGRAQEDFEDDTTRYNDASRMQTSSPNILYPEGLETYAKGYRSMDMHWPTGAGTWRYMIGSGDDLYYLAVEFTASASYNADFVELYFAKHQTSSGAIILELRDGSKTGTVLKTATLSSGSAADKTAFLYRFDWTGTQALTSGNTYALVIRTSYPGAIFTSDWMVLCGAKTGGYKSTDGVTWSSDSNPFFFRMCAADTDTHYKFFEYKRNLYAVSQPVTGNSFLFINGDRGAADSYGAVPTTLVDGTKTWTADEWISCTVLITNGPGSEEEQPWRIITDNDGTTLTVSPAWNVAHTTSTEYVILGSDKFTSELDLGGYVTDVCVADEFVYFARGDSGALNVLRYQAYNNAGTWTTRNAAEAHEAVHLCTIRSTDRQGDHFLFLTQNNQSGSPKAVLYGKVPRYWGDLYSEIATITVPGQPFTEDVIASSTQVNNGWSTEVQVAAGFTTGIICDEVMTATNITKGNKLAFEFLSNIALAAGTPSDLQLQYDNTASLASAISLNFPAITANEWTWVALAFTMNSDGTDYVEDAVISIGLYQAVDKGAATYKINNGIRVISSVLPGVRLPTDSAITGIIPYAGNASEPVVNPWVFTEESIFEIQTQSDYNVVRLPLGELASLRSENNGKASTVNDVYLWFNLTSKVERYYSRNLDDVGPDKDAGLPTARSGKPSAMLSYPGKVYVAIDASSGGTSSLLAYKSGWYEVYRGPRTNSRLFNMLSQIIPSDTSMSRLWIAQGCDIVRVDQSINPRQSSSFKYAPEGHLITSWIYANMQDVSKYFKSITLFLSDGLNSNDNIYLDYQKDNDTSWTRLGSFASANLTNGELTLGVNCKRIRFRFVVQTTITATPYIKAWLLKGIGIVPIKHGYTWTTKLTEGHLNADLYDLLGNAHGTLTTVDSVLAKLDTWASAATPLTLQAVYSALDGKTVILEDPGIQPLTYSPEPPETPVEEYVVNISCIDT